MDILPLDLHSQILSFQDENAQKVYVVAHPEAFPIYRNVIRDAEFWLSKLEKRFPSLSIPGKYCEDSRLLENFYILLTNTYNYNKNITFEYMHYEILLLVEILSNQTFERVFISRLISIYVRDAIKNDIILIDAMIDFFKTNNVKDTKQNYYEAVLYGIITCYEKDRIEDIPLFLNKLIPCMDEKSILSAISIAGNALKYKGIEKGLLLKKTFENIGYSISFPIAKLHADRLLNEFKSKSFDTDLIDDNLFIGILCTRTYILDTCFWEDVLEKEKYIISPIRMIVLISIHSSILNSSFNMLDTLVVGNPAFEDALDKLNKSDNLSIGVRKSIKEFEDS